MREQAAPAKKDDQRDSRADGRKSIHQKQTADAGNTIALPVRPRHINNRGIGARRKKCQLGSGGRIAFSDQLEAQR